MQEPVSSTSLHTAASGLTGFEAQVLASIDPGEAASLLQDLIRQRSDFPPGDTRLAVQVVAAKLAEAGVPVEVMARREQQASLLAWLGDPHQAPCLTFHAHIDTVPAGDFQRWSVDPFGGEIRAGVVYGRGAGDDKGSVAAQTMALITLARAGVNLKGCLQLAIVADEESGALEGTVWLRDLGKLKPDLLVIGEQTDNQVAIAERVACGIDLTVFGKGTHGAMPWAGENAVLKTARALSWLQERLFPVLQRRSHPYLPPATLNIGKIQGGIQWNIVPDWCKVEMDRRLLPGETREVAMQEIRAALDEFSREVEPLRYELFSQGEVAANVNTPDDHPFVSLANQALADVVGESRPLTGYVQTSDGRWFAGADLPIIIFGPSDPAVAHAPDEHVSVEQLVEAIRFLALLALRQLAGYTIPEEAI
jgi:acetylornithine deacetylase/succinyl-diaminopimelate desuccinylase family protein